MLESSANELEKLRKQAAEEKEKIKAKELVLQSLLEKLDSLKEE